MSTATRYIKHTLLVAVFTVKVGTSSNLPIKLKHYIKSSKLNDKRTVETH